MGYVEAKTVVKEPNLEECAKSMLEIFRSRNVASGQSLMASDVYIALFQGAGLERTMPQQYNMPKVRIG